MPEVGQQAPDFVLPSTQGQLRLSEVYKARQVILAFYTEDATPSCTQELNSFKKEYETIQQLGAEVIAVSVDTLDSHNSFCKEVGGYPFPLVSDTEGAVSANFGVLSEDGKRSNRAVYVIDQQGLIVHAIPWYQPNNPMQLLEVFKALGLEI